MSKEVDLTNSVSELKAASAKEIYREYKKTDPNTKEKKLIYELIRRLTMLEAKVIQMEERN